MYKNNHILRVTTQDDIIDFKLISKSRAMICFIASDGYHYKIIDLNTQKQEQNVEQKPYFKKYSFDNLEKLDYKSIDTNNTAKSKRYNELTNLRYASLYPSFMFDEYYGYTLGLNLTLQDPLYFNSFGLLANKRSKNDYDDVSLKYQNSRYYASFGVGYEKNGNSSITSPFIDIPIYQKRYYNSSFGLTYKNDTQRFKSLISSFDLSYSRRSFLSDDYYQMYSVKLYNKSYKNSDVYTNTLNINTTNQIFDKTFLKLNYKKSSSNSLRTDYLKGIFVGKNIYSNSDKTDFVLRGLKYNFYTKNFSKKSIEIKQKLGLSKYFYKVPISLKDEDIYMAYERYYIQGYIGNLEFYQKKIGLNMKLLLWHNADVNIQIEYIYNSLDDNSYSSVTLGTKF
jgi:hypothetical protein